ncbi:hypothetical protein F444_13094 [Phytophthora nicotianae P1976]|uniref:Uncharacterized protein n=1 Tax=Phytophthora nicotianae P1976 TaxID=1317066 RepID=A0A080ZUW8_PHYNI|nr:hypothetical protein F444_13094 [Phytophthora nicotianae P1976]
MLPLVILSQSAWRQMDLHPKKNVVVANQNRYRNEIEEETEHDENEGTDEDVDEVEKDIDGGTDEDTHEGIDADTDENIDEENTDEETTDEGVDESGSEGTNIDDDDVKDNDGRGGAAGVVLSHFLTETRIQDLTTVGRPGLQTFHASALLLPAICVKV